MPRAVILTALPVEYLAVRRHLTDLQEEMHPRGTIYERGTFAAPGQTWEVGIVETGAGNTGAALEAERAIAHFSPDVILFVGVAGGIKDVALGDVVASTKIYGYESGKAEDTFKPRPEIGLSDYGLEQRAKAEAKKSDWFNRLTSVPSSTPNVHVAPIVAGEKVIASTKKEVFNFLRSNYSDAVAVEMEGFGSLSAAFAKAGIKSIVVRGISDLVSSKESFSVQKQSSWQEIASNHASSFAFEVLSKLEMSSAMLGMSSIHNSNVHKESQALDTDFQQFSIANKERLEVTENPKLSIDKLNPQQIALQEIWNLRSEKIMFLRRALVIEAGAATKFQLEKQIQLEEEELNLLTQKLDSMKNLFAGTKD